MTQEQRHQSLVTIGSGHMEGADINLVSRVDTHFSRLRERDKHMSSLHSSDLRDSHEYTKKEVWGEQIFTRQHSRRFVKK